MAKEYRTIQEVAGPLMLVRGVEGVKYNELGEIELANGDTRRCKVLEIDGGNALVQLFEDSTGISWSSLGGLKGVKPPEAFGDRSGASPASYPGQRGSCHRELSQSRQIRG